VLGGNGFNTGLVEGTYGVQKIHGLGGAILALPRALATHATPLGPTVRYYLKLEAMEVERAEVFLLSTAWYYSTASQLGLYVERYQNAAQ